jgi:4-hydroxy-3-methylbut-2-enyl diphosphate reductase
MIILRALHLGMCFGVRDALQLALQLAQKQPVTVLGDLVHNETVMEDLQVRGVRVAQQPEAVSTRLALVTAHGASRKSIAAARNLGLEVREATCPLVHLAHRAAESLEQDGYHVVVIGKPGHVEVRGIVGDLRSASVILHEDEVASLPAREHFGVMAQTTQPIDHVRRMVERIRDHFPGAQVKFIDTVCHPTKIRQQAAAELAQQCEAVIVVGGAHSNNTQELLRRCRQFCAAVYHVQTEADLRVEWFAGIRVAGLTAGTSTPDDVIDRVESRMRELGRAVCELPMDETAWHPQAA